MQKEKNASTGIIIAILILVIIGMGIYLLYDKKIIFSEREEANTSVKEPSANSSDSSSTDKTGDSNSSKTTPKVLSGLYADSATTVILENGDVYVSFEPCPVNMGSYNGMYATYCSSINNIIPSYSEYNFENLDYEAINVTANYRYSKALTPKFLGLKLNTTKVSQVYAIMQGQATSPEHQGLALVKENGTLDVISFQSIVQNQLTPSTTSLQNIIQVKNVSGESSVNTIATDASGATHDLSEYLK